MEDPLLLNLRTEFTRRGGSGILGLSKKFKIIDDDNSKSLSPAEFKKAMKETSLNLSNHEIDHLFRLFDSNGQGAIDYEEFLMTLAGPMKPRRLKLVNMAYDVLDVDGSGQVDMIDFAQAYDVSKHPEFISKKKTKEQLLRELLDVFDVGGVKDGVVTRKEFENYYTKLSASIDKDDYFELMIRNAWHISGGEGQAANSANMRVLTTDKHGNQRVEEIKNDIDIKRCRDDGNDDSKSKNRNDMLILSRLNQQGSSAVSACLLGVVIDEEDSKNNDPKKKQDSRNHSRQIKTATVAAAGIRPRTADSSGVPSRGSRAPASYNSAYSHNNKKSCLWDLAADVEAAELVYQSAPKWTNTINDSSNKSNANQNDYCNIDKSTLKSKIETHTDCNTSKHLLDPTEQTKEDPLLLNLRTEFTRRGGSGILGLSKKFKIIDDDNSKSLSPAEFKKAMKETSLNLSNHEIDHLFRLFDSNGQGAIDYEEFLMTLAGPMKPRRLKLVNMAYDVLDVDGSGQVDMIDFAQAYDVSKHPEFISKKKTKEQLLRELLDVFDVGGVKDGVVTRKEFENYYTKLSASIDKDDYFELMIRNAWHISGGEGQAANSANMRVLTTDKHGNQRVEEIKNDIDIKRCRDDGNDDSKSKNRNDMLILSRLNQQGSSAVSACLLGVVIDEEDSKNNDPKKKQDSRNHSRQKQNIFFESSPLSSDETKPTLALVSENRIKTDMEIAIDGPEAKNESKSSAILTDADQSSRLPSPDPGVLLIINKIRNSLKQKSSSSSNASSESAESVQSDDMHSFVRLERLFQSMDTNDDGALNITEFKHIFTCNTIFPELLHNAPNNKSKSVSATSVAADTNEVVVNKVSEKDVQKLFEYFDRDGSKTINLDEFLHGIRGSIDNNSDRFNLVSLAYDTLDTEKLGMLRVQDVVSSYNASRHPEVLASRLTADIALKQFLENFDAGREIQGMVTKQEFFHYYSNINYFIRNDLYFTLLLRNTWNITNMNTNIVNEGESNSVKKTGLVDRLRRQTNQNNKQYSEIIIC